MAQYSYDFSAFPLGQPADWSTDGSEAWTWEVVDDDGHVFQLSASGTASARAIFYPDEVAADTDVDDQELVVRWRALDTAASNLHHVKARWTNTNNHYLVDWRSDNGFRWRKVVAGSFTTLYDDGTNTITLGDWFWTRVRFNGSNWSVKTWADGEAEPAGWDETGSDTSHASGLPGVGADFQTATHQFSFLGVGTDGDAAPALEEGDPSNFSAVADGADVNLSWDSSF